MPRPFLRTALSVAFASACLPAAFAAAPAPAAWVARSDALARPVLAGMAKFAPESVSGLGLEEFDTAILDLQPQRYERMLAETGQSIAALQAQRAKETDAKVRQDLDIMIDARQRTAESMRLQHQILLGHIDLARTVFGGLRALLDPRNTPERRARALVRLRRYAGTEPGYVPVATLARATAEAELARPGLIGPYVEEVRNALNNAPTMMKGIAELFRQAGLAGWEKDLETLTAQVQAYDDWVRATVLPRARQDVLLPRPLYAQALRNVGVDMAPETLIEQAAFDFEETRERMQQVAAGIAASRKLPSADYRDVLRALKQEQIPQDQMLAHYRKRMDELEAIIRREHLVTLPQRAAKMRLASDAEAAASPAPFMNPPRLIGNTGEYGEFVIPLRIPNAKSGARLDDFSNPSFSWTLTAHEARPGHELQFASLVEQGVSMARGIFAFNSANVEGWGLYAETLVYPHLPPEGQLFALQSRLWRMARAYLDPMINLGRITPLQAKEVLMRDVVMSEPMAQSEIDRYAFRAPGQATSYYYGYVRLRALRAETELLLGERFEAQAFNDFVIAQGLLPPPLLRQAVLDEFVPARKKAAPPKG